MKNEEQNIEKQEGNGVLPCAYFGKVCHWCKSIKTHYDYLTIDGGEVWQCDECNQEFLGDY